MSQRVVRYETSPVFINYEEQDLNFQNSHSDVRFQNHNSALDQTGVTVTKDVVSLCEDSPQILDTQITVIQQSCETTDANLNQTRGDLKTDLEVNARHDDNVISQQVNSFDSHDGNKFPYVIESDKKILRIHRLNLRQDMINTFEHIQFEIIDARGEKDDCRGLGAERDLYASFWSEVADSLCVGAPQGVPFVRNGFHKKEWESIGRILRRELVEANYFPTILSKAL